MAAEGSEKRPETEVGGTEPEEAARDRGRGQRWEPKAKNNGRDQGRGTEAGDEGQGQWLGTAVGTKAKDRGRGERSKNGGLEQRLADEGRG